MSSPWLPGAVHVVVDVVLVLPGPGPAPRVSSLRVSSALLLDVAPRGEALRSFIFWNKQNINIESGIIYDR